MAGQGPTAGESGIDLVPVQNLRLSQFPAEINQPPLEDGREINQAFGRAFLLDSQIAKLLDIVSELAAILLQFVLDLLQRSFDFFEPGQHPGLWVSEPFEQV